MQLSDEKGKLTSVDLVIPEVQGTEYTQSGNGRFLAYTFHHDGKIRTGLVRVGGARPPPFTLCTITYKVAVYAPAERADTHPLFHVYPYVLLWVLGYCLVALFYPRGVRGAYFPCPWRLLPAATINVLVLMKGRVSLIFDAS
jgi:hypothetical protein